MTSHEALSSSELYRGLGLLIPTKEVTRQDLFDHRILHLHSIITSPMNTIIKEENNIKRRASLRESWSQRIKQRAQLGLHGSTPSESSNYAQSLATKKPNRDLIEESFKYWQKFYADVPPLELCLATETERENEYLGDLQYERLMAEVKEPIPTKHSAADYRGEVQSRIFWGEVRKQLNVVDDEKTAGWPEGFSEPESYTPNGLQDCLTFRQPIFDRDVDVKWQPTQSTQMMIEVV